MIHFDTKSKVFYLHTKRSSYLFCIYKDVALLHLYWGKRLSGTPDIDTLLLRQRRNFSATDPGLGFHESTDVLPMEYPTYGSTDLRNPALCIHNGNRSRVTRYKYITHRITDGKPRLEGLPASYTENDKEAQTLEIELADDVVGARVFLSYSVFEEFDVITRNVRVVNYSGHSIKITDIMSASVDFQARKNMEYFP